jgi:hypothetical protein
LFSTSEAEVVICRIPGQVHLPGQCSLVVVSARTNKRHHHHHLSGLSSGARGNHPFSGGEVTIVRTPPVRFMFWGPRTIAAGVAAILCVRQLGSQALLLAPQLVKISNQGTVCNRYPLGISIAPAHNHSPPCIIIIQGTACRVDTLPPPVVR